ncbi:oxysterol-binding protein homolog 1 [Monosporozyma unispora]
MSQEQEDPKMDSIEESTISKPLLKLKLLNVLRKGSFDELSQLLDAEFVPKDNSNVKEVASLILHYAVQVAPLQLIKDIVDKRDTFNQLGFDFDLINVNEKDIAGNTPLHMAAFQSRADVVSYLMDLPNINDTIINNLNLQALEMCKDLNVAQLMQIKRSKYIAEIAVEFRTAFNNRDFQHLESILSKQRNFNLLDINGMDPKTGDTVLHEFVKKRDVIMCRWLLEHGADPFKRDAKGRLPLDLLKKVDTSNNSNGNVDSISNKTTATTKLAIDMELKKLLEKSAMEQSVIDITGVNIAVPATSSNTENKIVINSDANVNRIPAPPTFKGYLKKWTNFAQGYKLRYFILSADGKLSYFIDQSDTQNACRGSLSVSNCSLHLDSSEKLKFEIISGVHNSPSEIRWHLKGNHPIETNRWVWAIQGAIRYAKDKNRGILPSVSSPSQLHESLSLVDSVVDNSTMGQLKSADDIMSLHSSHQHLLERQLSPRAASSNVSTISKPNNAQEDAIENVELSAVDDQNDSTYLEESDDSESEAEDGEMFDIINGTNGEDLQITYGPFSHKLHMLKRSITIDFTELTELLSDESIKSNKNINPSNDIWNTVEKTLKAMNTNFEKLDELTQQRDKKLITMLSKQRDLNNVWIQSMKELELELIDKDTKLNNLSKERKQLKKLLDTVTKESHELQKRTTTEKKNDDKNASHEALQQIAEAINTSSNVSDSEESGIDEFFDAEEASISDNLLDTEAQNEQERNVEEVQTDSNQIEKVEQVTEKKDEIIETTTSVMESAIEPDIPDEDMRCNTKAQTEKFNELEKEGTFLGYEEGHRHRLKLDADNRPKVSLWGVLKSMVGKDVTKMTLPVSFNEPSSMLQRLAEDIEYSDILQYASQFSDSTLRMLYVAAFSVSPYSSTINRIAKPFNPLLGETFEYADKDKDFRFFTEQVSHHPPISASWAESPKWDYYGESNVDSKFTGRAFTIKHLGRWYVNIRPDNDPELSEETYTWMKPLNTVIGILVGKPEVDNSGEVRIENRTTGDYCVMTYKARGWTAVSAYEVRGDVYNKDGVKCWTFGGRWNNALFAKKIVSKGGNRTNSNANTDIEIDAKNDNYKTQLDEPKFDGTRFLIWKVHKRLGKVPFNLTPFAITLNDPQPKLLEWVAPTDTRLRPDQRAMEDGLYDEAATEKHRLEEKQRAVRKARDINKEKYHPKYFTLEKDPITQDRIWKFKGDYWNLRKQHKWDESFNIF